MSIRLKSLGIVLLVVMALFSCNSNESAEQGKDTQAIDYLGTWKRIPRKSNATAPNDKVVTFTITEKDNGLFMRYNNGTTYPLKYEPEGSYYYAVTPMGSVPLLFDQGVITINNGFEFRYQKVGKL